MYKLLLDEPPLIVLPSLAVKIGLNEAIILQQVHYWLVNAQATKRAENFREGRWWVYHSYPEWVEVFPFWSEKTVKRTFLDLEKAGLLLSARLAEDTWDRRKWYTIDYERYSAIIEGNETASSPAEDAVPASAQSGPMHRDKMGLWNGTNWAHGMGQDGPMERDNLGRSLQETKTTAETTKKTTAARGQKQLLSADHRQPGGGRSAAADSSASPSFESVEADNTLILALTNSGLNRADAQRLAASHPEECRRQLQYLPHVTSFKSSRGAYLRSAIEQGFAPPKDWIDAQKRDQAKQQKQQSAVVKQSAFEEKIAREAERQAALDAEKARLQAEEPDRWAEIVAEAQRQLPPPLRGKTGHVAYGPALAGNIERILHGALFK